MNTLLSLIILNLFLIQINSLIVVKKRGDEFNHPSLATGGAQVNFKNGKSMKIANKCGMLITKSGSAQVISNMFNYFPIDSYTSSNSADTIKFNEMIIDMLKIATVQTTQPSELSTLALKISPTIDQYSTGLKAHLLSSSIKSKINQMIKKNTIGFHWDIKLECDPLIYLIQNTELTGKSSKQNMVDSIKGVADTIKNNLKIAGDNEYVKSVLSVIDIIDFMLTKMGGSGDTEVKSMKSVVDLLHKFAVHQSLKSNDCSKVLYLALGVLLGSEMRDTQMTECWSTANDYMSDVVKYWTAVSKDNKWEEYKASLKLGD